MLLPTPIANILYTSVSPMNSTRPQLQGIDFNSTNQTFASTDTYRLTKFKPSELAMQWHRFPDYETFIPKSPNSTMTIPLKNFIELAIELKETKKSHVICEYWKMLVANTNEEKIVFKEPSPLNPDIIITLDIKFLVEFALSMKVLLKDNKYQSLSINYTWPRDPLHFKVITTYGTLDHIIMPVKTY